MPGRDTNGDLAVFAVRSVGHTLADDGGVHPTVVIDVAGHPEVADLARVHAVEGIGDVHTLALRSGDAVVLGVRLTAPVRAAFAVVFDLAAHGAFLDEVADAGSLTIATTDPDAAADERPWWLSVDIDGPALRAAVVG